MVMNIWPLAVKYTKICMSSKTTQVVLPYQMTPMTLSIEQYTYNYVNEAILHEPGCCCTE